jgi:hypothetical protein
LLRKMDCVVVSGFGARVGLGKAGEIWAWATDAKTETDNTTQAMNRNIRILL